MDQQKSCSLKLAPKKDARMFFSLIYFFAPFSIFYIPHNYVIPQAMPHAIPQTHSSFYPHRSKSLRNKTTLFTHHEVFSYLQNHQLWDILVF